MNPKHTLHAAVASAFVATTLADILNAVLDPRFKESRE